MLKKALENQSFNCLGLLIRQGTTFLASSPLCSCSIQQVSACLTCMYPAEIICVLHYATVTPCVFMCLQLRGSCIARGLNHHEDIGWLTVDCLGSNHHARHPKQHGGEKLLPPLRGNKNFKKCFLR